MRALVARPLKAFVASQANCVRAHAVVWMKVFGFAERRQTARIAAPAFFIAAHGALRTEMTPSPTLHCITRHQENVFTLVASPLVLVVRRQSHFQQADPVVGVKVGSPWTYGQRSRLAWLAICLAAHRALRAKCAKMAGFHGIALFGEYVKAFATFPVVILVRCQYDLSWVFSIVVDRQKLVRMLTRCQAAFETRIALEVFAKCLPRHAAVWAAIAGTHVIALLFKNMCALRANPLPDFVRASCELERRFVIVWVKT